MAGAPEKSPRRCRREKSGDRTFRESRPEFCHKGPCDRSNPAGYWQDLGTFLLDLEYEAAFTDDERREAVKSKRFLAAAGL